jgi:hypothetical protein
MTRAPCLARRNRAPACRTWIFDRSLPRWRLATVAGPPDRQSGWAIRVKQVQLDHASTASTAAPMLGVEYLVQHLPNCRNDHNVVLRHGVV